MNSTVVFQCLDCGNYCDSETKARECCALPEQYRCQCGNIFDDQDKAEECCAPGYSESQGWELPGPDHPDVRDMTTTPGFTKWPGSGM